MKKFVILTTQRTGSTYIRLWLNNHPNVRCHGEIFLKNYNAMDGFNYFSNKKINNQFLHYIFCNRISSKLSYNIVLKNLIKSYFDSFYNNHNHSGPWIDMKTWNEYQTRNNPDMDKAVGFKLMYGQLKDYQFLQKWIEDNNLYIIHLIRNNPLRVYISRLLMKKRGVSHSTSRIKDEKVFVNPNTIVSKLNQIVKISELMKKNFTYNPYLEITYEDFFNNYTKTSETILDFLGIENCQISMPSLRKTSLNSVKGIIENYEAVVSSLENTLYKGFVG